MTGERGIEKNMELAENRLEWRGNVNDLENNNNIFIS